MSAPGSRDPLSYAGFRTRDDVLAALTAVDARFRSMVETRNARGRAPDPSWDEQFQTLGQAFLTAKVRAQSSLALHTTNLDFLTSPLTPDKIQSIWSRVQAVLDGPPSLDFLEQRLSGPQTFIGPPAPDWFDPTANYPLPDSMASVTAKANPFTSSAPSFVTPSAVPSFPRAPSLRPPKLQKKALPWIGLATVGLLALVLSSTFSSGGRRHAT